ncbi:MAG: hypothetical protein ACHQXA_06060 [Gemmatimonadales bacterium]
MALEAGASYFGVICITGTRREASDAEAREVVSAAAGRPVFGVFGPGEVSKSILRRRDVTGIRGAQLHGLPSAELAERLRSEGMLVWRVARPADLKAAKGVADEAGRTDAVLVEPFVDGALGGTGQVLATDLAQAARAALIGKRMVLAGGLRPDTVAAAIALVRPDLVDVSSGVERSPGVKDAALLKAFLEAVVGDHPSP